MTNAEMILKVGELKMVCLFTNLSVYHTWNGHRWKYCTA